MAKEVFDHSRSVAHILHSPDVKPFSPVFGDVERVVSYDEDKKEVVSFVPVDYKKINDQRGVVENWSLEALLKAGINPNFPVHTAASVSRVEGVGVLQQAESVVENIINAKEE